MESSEVYEKHGVFQRRHGTGLTTWGKNYESEDYAMSARFAYLSKCKSVNGLDPSCPQASTGNKFESN
jgi:hypothetical protein